MKTEILKRAISKAIERKNDDALKPEEVEIMPGTIRQTINGKAPFNRVIYTRVVQDGETVGKPLITIDGAALGEECSDDEAAIVRQAIATTEPDDEVSLAMKGQLTGKLIALCQKHKRRITIGVDGIPRVYKASTEEAEGSLEEEIEQEEPSSPRPQKFQVPEPGAKAQI